MAIEIIKESDLEKRLKAIEDISYVCSRSLSTNLATLSEKVLKPFCQLTNADYGMLVLLKKPGDFLYVNASYGFPDGFNDYYNDLNFNLGSIDSKNNWPSVKSIQHKKILIIKDTNHDYIGFSSYFSNSISPNKIRAVISIPLIINNEAIGAFTKYYTSPQTFSETDLSFMKSTANIITSTIERNLLIEEANKSKIEIAEKNEDLKRINKELDSFVYIASHDLREPLRTIESFVSIIEERLHNSMGEKDKDFFSRIVRSTHKMRRLIQDLTSLSRASRGTESLGSEKIDLKQLITEVKFELTAFLEYKNAVIIENDFYPPVNASREEVSSIFKNLISNGVKFNISSVPTVKVSLVENCNPVKVTVCFEDNGIGIASKYHSKIFSLFQRLHTEDEYEGTGAGLAIVKKILEKYECDIWLESKEGEGSKFFITLPKYHG